MPIKKTITVDYDCWSKLRNYKTLIEQYEPGKNYSQIIEEGVHLLLTQYQEKYTSSVINSLVNESGDQTNV